MVYLLQRIDQTARDYHIIITVSANTHTEAIQATAIISVVSYRIGLKPDTIVAARLVRGRISLKILHYRDNFHYKVRSNVGFRAAEFDHDTPLVLPLRPIECPKG